MDMRIGSAAALGGTLSGIPSTVLDRHPVAATRAAGTLLGRPTLVRGTAAHVALSLGWAVALDQLLPRRAAWWHGAAAGLGIAALDLGIVGRRFPAIRALPPFPQVADHVAYGVIVAWALRRAPTRTAPARP